MAHAQRCQISINRLEKTIEWNNREGYGISQCVRVRRQTIFLLVLCLAGTRKQSLLFTWSHSALCLACVRVSFICIILRFRTTWLFYNGFWCAYWYRFWIYLEQRLCCKSWTPIYSGLQLGFRISFIYKVSLLYYWKII